MGQAREAVAKVAVRARPRIREESPMGMVRLARWAADPWMSLQLRLRLHLSWLLAHGGGLQGAQAVRGHYARRCLRGVAKVREAEARVAPSRAGGVSLKLMLLVRPLEAGPLWSPESSVQSSPLHR